MPSPLREYRVLLQRVPVGEPAIDPDRLGERSKLGGMPDWVQNDETPRCTGCGELMTFVGQLDSLEHQSTDNPHSIDALSSDQKFMFGDVGMIYVFFCKDCLEPVAIFQCA